VAFVGMMKLASRWFSARQFATATGLSLLIGISGAVAAGVPLRLLVTAFGWRPVIISVCVLTAIIALLIWKFAADDPEDKGYASHAPPLDEGAPERVSVIASVAEVLKNTNALLILIGLAGLCGPMLAFGGLWGVPYCAARFGLAPKEAAWITSSTLLATGIGSPIMGWLSDKLSRRKMPLLAASIVSTLCWMAAIWIESLPLYAFTALAMVAGAASGTMVVGFAFGKESVPARYAGTVGGVINMGAMGGPMLLQPAMGLMLDKNWSGAMAGAVRLYDMPAYNSAFLLIILWNIVAFLALLPTKETGCRQS